MTQKTHSTIGLAPIGIEPIMIFNEHPTTRPTQRVRAPAR